MKKGFTNTPVILSASEGSRNGFTLMELLVYMMIVGIIVIVAGQAFSNSTKFRVRTQNMLRATQTAEGVASLFKEDVAQMGAKSAKDSTVVGDEDIFEKYTSCSTGQTDCIYMDPNNENVNSKDYSSYNIVSGTYDNLTIRRIRYDTLGHYQAIEQVNWYVENKVLKRSCKVLRKDDDFDLPAGDPCSDGAASTPDPVDIAEGVEKFKVYPGIPTIRSDAAADYQEEDMFPSGGASAFKLLARPENGDVVVPQTVTTGGSSVTVTGFAVNYDFEHDVILTDGKSRNELYVAPNNAEADVWNTKCAKINFEPEMEYELSFYMPYISATDAAQMFVPGRDHMAVGFRNATGEKPKKGGRTLLDDFLFYPPTNDKSEGKRAMRFSVPEAIANVCIAFTFATYSPAVSAGSITISDLKLRRVAGANYEFDKNKSLNIVDKKNVKALMLELQIARGGKGGEVGETGDVTIVVPTPSNGLEH